jgi:nitrite reductase (NO-forming)
VETWGRLRPVHPWLNLLGFVSLVVATTLLHFFPTVVGARIADIRSARVTVAALAAGVPLVSLGFALQADLVARAGALLGLWGGLALAIYCLVTWRTRARWTGDRGWHVFAMGGLVSAIAWFELGLAWAAGRVLVLGPDPAAFTTDVLIGPLVVGWVGLTILASATHLVPSVGPGHPIAHARQRQILGHRGAARLVAADLGIAALSAGLPLRSDPLVLAGALLVAVALAATGALIAWAIAVGLRDPGLTGRPGQPSATSESEARR